MPAVQARVDRSSPRSLTRIAHGGGSDGDLREIEALLGSVTDSNRCYLGTEVQRLVASVLREFPDDFAAHLEGRPPLERDVVVPKIVEIDADGAVVYDERHRLKLPDWTYAERAPRSYSLAEVDRALRRS